MVKECSTCMWCREDWSCQSTASPMQGVELKPGYSCDHWKPNKDGVEYAKLIVEEGGVTEIKKANKKLMDFVCRQYKGFEYGQSEGETTDETEGMTSASRQIVETCGTCQWWDNGVCLNYDSDMYQTGEANTCPCWENYDEEFWGDE